MDFKGIPVILASRSPRRRELLGRVLSDFQVIVAEDVDEKLPDGVHPREGVALLAKRKGEPISDLYPNSIVISSDTLVELDGVPLGKPKDKRDAERILGLLSAREHNVHTGVAISYRGKVSFGTATSSVRFRELSKEEIKSYIATGEPMDKAGAYGIQGEGGKLVLDYSGDFDTIMGLSLALTEKLLGEIFESL